MTEVFSSGLQGRESRISSTIKYDASHDLALQLGELMTDEWKDIHDGRTLKLASRAMQFTSQTAYRSFKAQSIEPRIRQNADLSRVDFSSRVAWETRTIKDPDTGQAHEINRIYFEPRPIQEIALSSLYSVYARREQIWYNDTDRHDRMQAGSLSFTVAARDLAVGREDGLALLKESLAHERWRSTVYASNPGVFESRS